MRKLLLGLLKICFVASLGVGCSDGGGNIIKEIKIGEHNNNILKIEIAVTTKARASVFIEYWRDSAGNKQKITSPISPPDVSHVLVLCNILPQTNYSFDIVTVRDGVKSTSKQYAFTSRALPVWLQDQFKYSAANTELLPQVFKGGFLLLNKRETPGVAYIVDYKGQLKWYHTVDGTGFKVTHFTKDTSIISILGKNDEPTSYGSEILEINLSGDTLMHLKKGQADFDCTIHHEILKRNRDEIVTLTVDERIMDLSSVGGTTRDTVSSDGILIMDRKGNKRWRWSVFDVMDPLKDPQILKTRKDWTHANSLNYDKDGNYLLSFYNNGQIWKIDSKTGQVLWKFGKGGNFTMPAECDFTQSHAVHINPYGSLMFFDNGVERRRSEVFSLKLDEERKLASMDLHIKLPPEVYNDRMGSAYMIDDSTVLCCCSKKHITVLANREGVLLWTLQSAIPPYRVEFLRKELLQPFVE